jgi:hypothetical protein
MIPRHTLWLSTRRLSTEHEYITAVGYQRDKHRGLMPGEQKYLTFKMTIKKFVLSGKLF